MQQQVQSYLRVPPELWMVVPRELDCFNIHYLNYVINFLSVKF